MTESLSSLIATQRRVLVAAFSPWPLSPTTIGREADVHGKENVQRHLNALRAKDLVGRWWAKAEHGMQAGYVYRTTAEGTRLAMELQEADRAHA